MKKQLTKVVLAASVAVVAWSCNQSDPVVKGDYIQGVFVINEGNFQQNNGAVSFFRREQKTAQADVYLDENGSTLKGGVQGYAVSGGSGIILVDNDKAGLDKAEIVDPNTFKKIATIASPDIDNPRKVVVLPNSSKAYISCWGTNADFTYKTGYIAVIDLATNKLVKKITIPNGPEKLVLNNGKLFVGTYSFGGGKNLTVINTATDEVLKTIPFSSFPTPIGIDANGKLWVNSGLDAIRLNADTYAVEATLKLATNTSKYTNSFAFSSDLKTIFFVLAYDDANYVAHGETYKFAITDTQVNVTTPFIKRYFTGLSVDPSQGLIYAGLSPSYGQSGYAIRYRTDGSLVDSVKVGIAPTGFVFRQ